MIRTKAVVKGAIVVVDAAPFRAFYQKHYGIDLTLKKKKKADAKKEGEKLTENVKRRWASRAKGRVLEKALADQIRNGKVLARISSRPGQVGKANGYILEGAELAFYQRKMQKKKSGKKE